MSEDTVVQLRHPGTFSEDPLLNKLPKGVQPRAKQHLQDIWMAETKEVAEKAFDFFLEAYQPVDEVFPGRSRRRLIL